MLQLHRLKRIHPLPWTHNQLLLKLTHTQVRLLLTRMPLKSKKHSSNTMRPLMKSKSTNQRQSPNNRATHMLRRPSNQQIKCQWALGLSAPIS